MSLAHDEEWSRAATPAERELWLAAQLADDAAAFTTAHAFRFDGRLDEEALARAWDDLLVAAPHLSARFVPRGEELMLIGAAEAAPRLSVTAALSEAVASRAADRIRDVVFDVATGPMCRAELIRRSDAAEDTLVIAISHLVADGFAWSILLSGLREAYDARRSGDRSGVRSLRQPAATPVADGSTEWAVRNLASLPHPARRPRPVRQARPRAIVPLPTGIRMSELPSLAVAAAALAVDDGGRPRVVVDVPFLARSGPQLRMPSTAMNVVPIAVDARATDAGVLVAECAAALTEAGRHAAARTEQARRRRVAEGAPPPVADVAVNIIPFEHELVLDGRVGSAATLSSGPGDVSAIAVRATGDGWFQVEVDAEAPDSEAESRSLDLAGRFLDAVEALRGGRLPASTPREVPADPAPDVIDVIAERVRDRPSSPAFLGGEAGTVTYGRLWQEAEWVAARILEHDLAPEGRVGVCASRGARHAAGILGVLIAGAAFVPLPSDPEDAVSRRRIADAVGLDLVVADEAAAGADLAGIPRLVIGGGGPAVAVVDAPEPHPEQLAYVIATSGSTGAPKPVAITRGALSGWTRSILRDYLVLGPSDRVAQFAAVQFDASIEELFSALSSGSALVPRGPRALENIGEWLDECGEAGITVLDLPTGYWHELTRALAAGRAQIPASVRTVIIGGEAASPERVRQWRSFVDARVRLVNTYGPTEATVVATRHVLAGPAIV
jgi:nonribosomal peptide synthetase MxcG